MASKRDESSYSDAAAEKQELPVTNSVDGPVEVVPLENIQKSRWERSWPTIACGAGLFSDGYLNGVGRWSRRSDLLLYLLYNSAFEVLTRTTAGDWIGEHDPRNHLS